MNYNTEINDLRIIICLRKSEVIVEKISVCNVIEKLMEHGMFCHAPVPMMSYICYRGNFDVILISK